MSKFIENWKSKWFGIWKEYGQEYNKCPSIKDFIAPEIVKGYDLISLKNYLANSEEIATTSRDAFPHPFTGQAVDGCISYRTDGKWVWLDDLPEYIEQYQVAIPNIFLEYIKKNKYVPAKWSGNPQKLEWPPIDE